MHVMLSHTIHTNARDAAGLPRLPTIQGGRRGSARGHGSHRPGIAIKHALHGAQLLPNGLLIPSEAF
eukprot:1156858-Pelagomonas_calceolata.AAC.4